MQNYENDLHIFAQSGSHSHGVKSPCCLNMIDGFHVTDNYCVDPMHTLLEGVVPYELGCVLYQLLSATPRLTTLSQLSNRIRFFFFDRNNVDRHNRPPHLNRIEAPGNGVSPSMKAVQMWALLRFLPLILGDLIPFDNPYWKFILHLSELVDFVFAPVLTKGAVCYLRGLIAEHLRQFKELFGPSVKLKPKHHLLVHIPSAILKNGPMVGMSCLGYEMKNSFFKRSAGIVCNFKNISKTLAYRHQYNAFHARTSKQFLRNTVYIGNRTYEALRAGNLEFFSHLCDVHCDDSDEIVVATQVTVGSVTYRKGVFLLLTIDEFDVAVFGSVVALVSLRDSESWYVVMHRYRTSHFNAHVHAFEVLPINPAQFHVVNFEQLPDRTALVGCTMCAQSQKTFLQLAYHVS